MLGLCQEYPLILLICPSRNKKELGLSLEGFNESDMSLALEKTLYTDMHLKATQGIKKQY